MLGRGGMGVVYHVRESHSGRELALKLALEPSLDERRLERFRREGELTARLDHPGIVRIHDAGTADGRAYLTCSLVEGARPLGVVLPELGLRERVALLRDVALAVGHAHARGVIHRDLKPDNVLVDRGGRAQVTDFGLAAGQDLDRLTRTGALVGTPTHMSPEQVEGRREDQGPATDVWALGVILYEALTGRLPFDGKNVIELAVQISSRLFEAPRDVAPDTPPGLEAICLRALEDSPRDRYPDGDALAAELDAWLRGETPEALGRGRVRRVMAVLGLVVAAGVAGALAAALSRTLALPPPSVRPKAPVSASSAAPSAAPSMPSPWPAWVDTLTPSRRPPRPLPPGLSYTGELMEVVNGRDGSRLLWVPPGSFDMGGEAGRAEERPVHRVTLSGYFIGKFEVSAAQMALFCEETGEMQLLGETGHVPAAFLPWRVAAAYCEWAGLRLPTEAEWEFAARGDDGRRYPWGDGPPGATRCNVDLGDSYARYSPPGAFPGDLSPAGCFDMGGNVQEWVADFMADYPADPVKDPTGPSGGQRRLSRGGDWRSGAVGATRRSAHRPDHASGSLGFRVAR